MALTLDGKTALVTGGGSGICLAFTKKLLEGGCNVVVADLNLPAEAKSVLDGAAGSAKFTYVKTDVTDWNQLQKAFDVAMKDFGRLDIVCPGAGVFEPDMSSFWCLNKGADTNESSSYKSLDINVAHPIRATQLAIDYFLRQKLGHGVVLLISSIAAQMPLLPIPLYTASKHAISAFARSLSHLEPTLNIRVNAVAPGVVKTPIWSAEKSSWVDESQDTWVTVDKVVGVMIDLITKPDLVGGTVLEVGAEAVRSVQELNDPGPSGAGFTVAKIADGYASVYAQIEQNFGK